MNLAFVISPIIAGFVITRLGFSSLYALSGAIFILAMLLSLRFTRGVIPKRKRTGNMWKGLVSAWGKRDLRFILIIQFLLQFFFSWMVIYTPLCRLADAKLGEKELLGGGFVLAAITTGIVPLISSNSIWVWALILFGTRVGAAMIEGMSATYFYKKVEASDIDLIALFRDMRPVAYIVGPLLASLVMSKFSTGALFPILAGIMLAGALIAPLLHDTR